MSSITPSSIERSTGVHFVFIINISKLEVLFLELMNDVPLIIQRTELAVYMWPHVG